MSLFIFHIQTTPAFHLEIIFQLEAIAYNLILQAELEFNLRGFLPWTYGNTYARVNVLLLFLCERGGISSSVLGLGV